MTSNSMLFHVEHFDKLIFHVEKMAIFRHEADSVAITLLFNPVKQIFFIVFHIKFIQKIQILLPECFLPVMLLLV